MGQATCAAAGAADPAGEPSADAIDLARLMRRTLAISSVACQYIGALLILPSWLAAHIGAWAALVPLLLVMGGGAVGWLPLFRTLRLTRQLGTLAPEDPGAFGALRASLAACAGLEPDELDAWLVALARHPSPPPDATSAATARAR